MQPLQFLLQTAIILIDEAFSNCIHYHLMCDHSHRSQSLPTTRFLTHFYNWPQHVCPTFSHTHCLFSLVWMINCLTVHMDSKNNVRICWLPNGNWNSHHHWIKQQHGKHRQYQTFSPFGLSLYNLATLATCWKSNSMGPWSEISAWLTRLDTTAGSEISQGDLMVHIKEWHIDPESFID